MRVYKVKQGIVIEKDSSLFLLENQHGDAFINDDNLFGKIETAIKQLKPLSQGRDTVLKEIQAPIQSQEVWASGVTYLRSKVGRQEESKSAGGSDFYARVYEAERPELFFKATPGRVAAPGGKVRIRKDSTWDVPEPELTLMVTSSGKIVGYTIGNDMSSRSIEGENPLYLPQAKTYDGCAAIGPCIYVTGKPFDITSVISLEIIRQSKIIFNDSISVTQMKRSLEELVAYVFRACSFPSGCLIMTGTGIVPPNNFTLQSGDEIKITIENIGTLVNTVS